MSRILVDASAAFDQRAGVGRYSRNILERLVPTLPDTDWTLFHAPAPDGAGWQPPQGARHVRYPIPRRLFDLLSPRLGVPLPVRSFTGRQDLVYSPDFVAPPMRGVPRIVTVHDIAFDTHPHLATPGVAAFLTATVQREMRRGAWIAAVSDTTRQRLIERYGIASERVRVVPNGVDQRFFTATPLSEERLRELGIPERFLLMVGTIEPRKNHAAVLRATARRTRAGLPVVVVGRPGWGTDDEVAELRRLRQAGRVVWLDDFADHLLPGLYAASTGVLYPSWTEGFGLPVLEALAAGKPVVTGNDLVFREVGGDQVVMIDPADDDALLEAMNALEEAPQDERAVAARRTRAAHFGWDRSVRMLVEFIRDIEEFHR